MLGIVFLFVSTAAFIMWDSNVPECRWLECGRGGTLNTSTCSCDCRPWYTGILCQTRQKATVWPQGSYGLLETMTGCPEGAMRGWVSAFVNLTYTDGDSHDTRQRWSDELFLLGPYHYRTMQLNICVKKDMVDEEKDLDTTSSPLKENVSTHSWPAGEYCVVKVVDMECPRGFHMANISLPGYAVTSSSRTASYLIDYVKDSDTFYLKLCCRTDYDPNNIYELPTSKAFFLVQTEDMLSPCPFLDGLVLYMRYFDFLTSDGTRSQYRRLGLCYYVPKARRECLDVSDGGASYRGRQETAGDGTPCTNWLQTPWAVNPTVISHAVLEDNYCRLYDNKWNEPSCRPVITVAGHSLSACSIPECSDPSDLLKRFAAGTPVFSSGEMEGSQRLTVMDGIIGNAPFISKRFLVEPWVQADVMSDLIIHKVVAHIRSADDVYGFFNVVVWLSRRQFDFFTYGARMCDGPHSAFRVSAFSFKCASTTPARYITLQAFINWDPDVSEASQNSMYITELEIYAEDTGCNRPLGLASGFLHDFQISSSSDSLESLSTHARLYRDKGWCSNIDDLEPYIEVDLLTPVVVNGFAVQGWFEGTNVRYVKSVHVGYRTGNESYSWITDETEEKTMEYNIDLELSPGRPQNFVFESGILMRQIRFVFTLLPGSSRACIKLEVFGCPVRPVFDLRCVSGTSTVIGWQIMRHYHFRPPMSDGSLFWLHVASWDDCFKRCKEDDGIDRCEKSTQESKCDMLVLDKCLGFTYDHDEKQCILLVGPRTSRHTKQWLIRDGTVTSSYTQRMCMKGVLPFSQCGQTFTSEVELASPSYPLYYGEGLKCEWRVRFEAGKHVKLTVVDVQLASPQAEFVTSGYRPAFAPCTDTLVVSTVQDSKEEEVWSINGVNFKSFTRSELVSRNSEVKVTLRSCYRFSQSEARGFLLQFTYSDCPGCQHVGMTCPGMAVCNDSCGYINSPLFPHMYEPFSSCQWKIQGRTGEYVEVNFLWLDVIGGDTVCSQDYVQLFDFDMEDTRSPLTRYCAERRPYGSVQSSWTQMGVDFYSNGSPEGSGFQIKYILVKTSLGNEAIVDSDGWYQHGSSKYQLNVHEGGVTWHEALDKCVQTGGHLVSIGNGDEMVTLYSAILASGSFTRRNVFIGLSRSMESGWSWVDGSPLSYTDWYRDPVSGLSQPDGQDKELCGMLVISTLHSTATWHDVACAFDQINQFICERNMSTPEDRKRPAFGLNDPSETGHMTYLFRCDNGELISSVYKCDGFPDCRYASDENCETTESCDGVGFSCHDGDECVSLQLYCDGTPDCADGSDEEDCVFPACGEAHMFQCTNSQCVNSSHRCDLKPDCLDGSDEESCDFCPDSTFTCYDGTCIPLSKICDGYIDCSGSYYEDEAANCVTRPEPTCGAWYLLGQTQNGAYLIRPDGVEPFQVECRFTGTHAVTTVHHDKEDVIRITEDMGTADVLLQYQASRQQINSLKASSYQCRQFVRMRCHHSNTILTGNVYWTSWEGEKYTLNSSPFYCCLLSATCKGRGRDSCNCEPPRETWYGADDNDWREDADYIVNLVALPILKMYTTNVDFTEVMEYRVGPLECFQVLSRQDMESRNFLCESGQTVPPDVRCLLRFDQFKQPVGCKDLSHLRNCESVICPEGYVKCPGSYCISAELVCDKQNHCENGVDEADCENFECPGLFHCKLASTCLPWVHVCDGVTHCPRGDDEFGCNVTCPEACSCKGPSVECTDLELQNISDIPRDVRQLTLMTKTLSFRDAAFDIFPKLYKLNLSATGLDHVSSVIFRELRNLRILDLSFNSIDVLQIGSFRDLQNLNQLYLKGNVNLRYIFPGSFEGLQNMLDFDLSNLGLEALDSETFRGLKNVRSLKLVANKVSRIADDTFMGLDNLEILDIRENQITQFSGNIFSGLDGLLFLYTDSYMFCCVRPESVPADKCLPAADEFSSCADLMRNQALRLSLWILGFTGLLGNMAVLAYRLIFDKDGLSRSNGIFVANLSIADFFMGIYMLIIASADQYFRGRYSWNDADWRNGWLCNMSGFVSMVSAEASVLFLCTITIDRCIAIMFPFSRTRLRSRGAWLTAAGIWTVVILLASVPFLPLSYFKGRFFSRSGVCLALPLTRDKPPGWEYSTAIFVVFNFLCFVVIAFGQGAVYREIRLSGRSVQKQQRRIDLSVARKLSFIVMSDFLCWFPVTVMGLLAMRGHVISGDVYAWVAVFVLPINSALNPIIYTLSSIGWNSLKTHLFGKHVSRSLSNRNRDGHKDYQSVIKQLRAEDEHIVFQAPDNSRGLGVYLTSSDSIFLRDILYISRHTAIVIDRLHSLGLVSGLVQEDNMFLGFSKQGTVCNLWAAFNPSRPLANDDFYKDIGDYGRLVSKMLRAFTRSNHHKREQDTPNS